MTGQGDFPARIDRSVSSATSTAWSAVRLAVGGVGQIAGILDATLRY